MFKAPFSFKGRIRRLEYGISVIIHSIMIYPLSLWGNEDCYTINYDYSYKADWDCIFWFLNTDKPLVILLFIPLTWFLYAQGT